MHRTAGPNDDLTLWQTLTTVRVNPKNGKCTTLPIFNLRSPYARNFHLWVSFSSVTTFSSFRFFGTSERERDADASVLLCRSWLGFWAAL